MSTLELAEELQTRRLLRPVVALVALQLAFLSLQLASPVSAQAPVEAAAPRVPTPLVALPRAVSSFGAATLDGWLYVTGGHSGRTHHYGEAEQWGGFARARLDALGMWEELPGGEKLQGTALVAAAGKLVRIGGMKARGEGKGAVLNSSARVSAYDPASATWTELPSLPEPRSSHDAVAIGTTLVVLGGWDMRGHSDDAEWARHGFALDLARPELGWRRIEQPFVERGLALASDGREVFVLGGMDEGGAFSRAARAFEPSAGRWRDLPPLPCDGFGLAAVCEGGALLASTRDGSVWRLEPAASAWDRTGTLALERGFHRLVAAHGALLALGGSAGNRPLAWIERVAPDAQARALATIPFPGHARQRQGLFLDGTRLGLLGGNVSLEQHHFGPEDFLAETWSVELGSGELSALAPLPRPRQSMVCVALPDGDVLAMGGFGHDGAKDRTFDAIWRLSAANGTWSELEARLPQDMTQFRALVHAGELWLVGGMNFDREREKKMELSDVLWKAELAHLERGFTDTGLRLPAPRRAFGAALIDGKLYLAGGLDQAFEAVPSLDVLDLATREWRTLAAPPIARLSPEMVALDGRLYLCAGLAYDEELDTHPVTAIDEFDPATGAWSTLATPLPLVPDEVQAFVWNGRLGFVSTWNERGALELAWLDPRGGA